MEATKVARPRHLREALGLAFVHRGRIRWRAGRSGFLGLEYPGEGDGIIVDVGDVPEFRAIESDRYGLQIGAFADHRTRGARAVDSQRVRRRAVRSRGGALPAGGAGRAADHRRHGRDAHGAARTRSSTRGLPPNEIPLAVKLKAELPRVAFADRRIRRRDGVATFELRVFVALALAGVHRIGTATVAYTVDGGAPMALAGVADPLAGTMIAKGTFADAARRAADAFRGDDEKTSVLRRTIIPLVLSALKEAYDSSRSAPEPGGGVRRSGARRNTRR